MRKKAGTLTPIEQSILVMAMDLRRQGFGEFHGFHMAKEIKERDSARFLTARGTLYRALGRLERQGLLQSRWEDPFVAAQQSRPRRKFYKLTAAGEAALVAGLADTSSSSKSVHLAWGTSP